MNEAAKTDVVTYVFTRLAATYGAAWDRSLGQAPIADVMTVWAFQLQAFTQTNPAKKMILWALDNLPERCPNAVEFKNLCRQSPAPATPLLDEPPANPERMAQELAKLAPMLADKPGPVDDKAWARKFLARVQAGERVNRTGHQMAMRALGLPDGT